MKCETCGKELTHTGNINKPYKGRIVRFCSSECKEEFDKSNS